MSPGSIEIAMLDGGVLPSPIFEKNGTQVKTAHKKSSPKFLGEEENLHPGRLTWNLKMMVWTMISSSRGAFSGSMLIFRGVFETAT